MDARDWIELGIFLLAAIGGLIAVIRYIDTQINGLRLSIIDRAATVDKELGDKVSIGEYTRRHEDLEKRLRLIERWQDHANGRARFYYPKEGEEDG